MNRNPLATQEFVLSWEPGTAHTFVDVLRARAAAQPDHLAFSIVQDRDEETVDITFVELDRKARAVASFLQDRKMQGERALLLLGTSLEFISAFFGCLYAGVIAVPGFPFVPGRRFKAEDWVRAVIKDAEPRVAIIAPRANSRVSPDAYKAVGPLTLEWVSSEILQESGLDDWRHPNLESDAIALLQYTSGSTATPKGVMVSHGNLLHNQKVIQSACDHTVDSTVVSWLPLHHDMGLVGSVLQPAYVGARSILTTATKFLQNPVRWLKAISQYRAHSSSAPNFAYDLCTRRISAEQKAGLDLTSWRVAVNGAEPVRSETMERFALAFAECGFNPAAFRPSYGLAESTLMVSCAQPSRSLQGLPVSARALERNSVQEPQENETPRMVVGCGDGLPGDEIRIVSTTTHTECAPDEVGEIWLKGQSVTKGYWNRPEETRLTFQAEMAPNREGPFLRTGDFGFKKHGGLFLTGRLKDLIIIHGRNFYPQDIELTVQACDPGLRSPWGAAFSVEVGGNEQLVIVNELEHNREARCDAILFAIRQSILREHGLSPYQVVLVRAGSIPKTTSGKVQRSVCRALWLENKLEQLSTRTFYENHFDSLEAQLRTTRLDVLETDPFLRVELMQSLLQSVVARILRAQANEIPLETPLVALGFDSLAAVRLKAALEEQLGVELDPVDLLQGLNLWELAVVVVDKINETGQETAKALVLPQPTPTLSHGQKGLWVHQHIAPTSTAYNLGMAARVRNSLDVSAIEQAFRGVVSRNEVLRTSFPVSSGTSEPVQQIHQVEDLRWDRHFYHVELSPEESVRLPQIIGREVQQPFPLQDEPPVRLTVYRLDSGKYVLLLAIHHIIADFWSLGLFWQQLAEMYSAAITGQPLDVSSAATTYRAFVASQTDRLEGPQGDTLLEYWREQLSGDLPVLQLPQDRPRPPVQSFVAGSEDVPLGRDLFESVARIAGRNGVTHFMVLLAAFQILLHRVSGQDDLLLGCPTAGRREARFLKTLGYFVNPVVLRCGYLGDLPFDSYLTEVERNTAAALKHQDYPFSLLVEKLHTRRHTSVPPVFQAMIVWQKAQPGLPTSLGRLSLGQGDVPIELGPLSLESIALPNQGTPFDLTVMLTEDEGELYGILKYNTELFDATTIKRFGAQFSSLLRAIALEPDTAVCELPLDSGETNIGRFCQAKKTEPAHDAIPICVHELFEQHVLAAPDSTALVFEHAQLNFAQLNASANRFARHLRGLGAGPEVRVGIFLRRSIHMIPAILGIWKAGAAYVPLDPRDPKQRLTEIIEDSGLEILITHEQLLDRLPETLPRLVLLDLDLDLIGEESAANLENLATVRNLAYEIYTSGSTGKPKGVMVEHGSVMNLLEALHERIYLPRGASRLVVGLNAPLAFDSSVKQLLALVMGHCLCLLPDEVRNSGAELLGYVREHHVDILDCTPSHAQMMMETGLLEPHSPLTLLVGGEPISPTSWNVLSTLVPTSYNLYGPTECAVDTAVCEVDSKCAPSIGEPLPGTSLYLLDRNMRPVPPGVTGEIFIGGEGVGRGYRGMPGLTADRFVPCPFSPESGVRLYRTGDRGRCRSDEKIEFMGRVDRQVKIRGFRIELDEVETALRQCPNVKGAVAVVYSDESGGSQLLAYVVAIEEWQPQRYRKFLADRLPEYMVPAIIMSIAEIPKNRNGKTDYQALPTPATTWTERGNDYVGPQSPLEQYLVDLWTDALHIQPIGIHDNFFALGGDSLQATRLLSRLQEKYPTDTPLLALFFHEPTISALAEFIKFSTSAQA